MTELVFDIIFLDRSKQSIYSFFQKKIVNMTQQNLILFVNKRNNNNNNRCGQKFFIDILSCKGPFKKPSFSKQPFPDVLQYRYSQIFRSSQRKGFAKFLRTLFLTKHLRASASQCFAKFTGKHLCKSFYVIKFQNVSMQLY